YREAAGRLSEQRATAAKKLAKLAEMQINELAMNARFGVDVAAEEQESSWSASGWDRVEARIATNPGEPMKPLEEIASGGEMSRVMLALKVAVEEGAAGLGKAGSKNRKTPSITPASRERSPGIPLITPASRERSPGTPLPRTLVFDEIDIGIGGRAAEAVGQKLKALARGQQVICITHLPQIAAFADQHFLIEKTERRGRTQTGVRRMEQSERVEEIARMLSGASLTETSRRHAEQMLKQSV